MFAPARSVARRPGSHLALAMAMLCAGAVGLTALATPAYAAKRDNERENAPKANYSKAFTDAYKPVEALSKATPADAAALRAAVPSLLTLVETADDRNAAGGLVFNIGLVLDDIKLQRQGLDLMIASGKIAPEKQGQYHFSAGQLAYNDDDYAVARDQFQQAEAAGFQNPDIKPLTAESYFQEDKFAEGLSYLGNAIGQEVQAGRVPPEQWIKRGFAMAYNNDEAIEAVRFSTLLARHYPSTDSWGDAIAVQRTFFEWDEATQLDLMRLAWRTESMRSERDYVDYLAAADARRLPAEAKMVAAKGVKDGLIDPTDPFVAENITVADSRIELDRKDLPELERAANAASATLVTVNAAADTLMSYGMNAEAEALYAKELGMPGVDADRVNTRLGIALADQGKYAEATAAFDKVQGPRAQIVALWKMWVSQKMRAAAPVAPAPAAAEPVT